MYSLFTFTAEPSTNFVIVRRNRPDNVFWSIRERQWIQSTRQFTIYALPPRIAGSYLSKIMTYNYRTRTLTSILICMGSGGAFALCTSHINGVCISLQQYNGTFGMSDHRVIATLSSELYQRNGIFPGCCICGGGHYDE